MAIKASSSITLSSVVDVKAVYRYYLLQSSTLVKPSKPTTNPPSSSWVDTEPTYTSGSTNSLYTVDLTVFSDDTWVYSEVSLSSAYEAAKAAYNKAVSAQNGVDTVASRVTDAETSISRNTEAIELCATKTEVETTLEGYYTRTETDAAISVESNAIKSSVSATYATKSDVANVQIGGTNLIRNSAFNEGVESWSPSGQDYWSINADEFDGSGSFEWQFSDKTTSEWYGATQVISNEKIKEDGQFILSGWAYVYSDITPDDGISAEIKKVYTETNYHESCGGISLSVDDFPKDEWFYFKQTFNLTLEQVDRHYVYFWIGRNGHAKITRLKLERGNKASDWSPAPEDIDADLDRLDDVEDVANDNASKLSSAESSIEILLHSIETLVRDENGQSMMTQTSEGWHFSTADIQSAIKDTSDALAALTDDVGSIDSVVSILNKAVNDIGAKTDYVNIGTYSYTNDSGVDVEEPCIELGESDNDYKVLVTNTQILFKVGSLAPTRININGLVTENIVIENDHKQTNKDLTNKGYWIWAVRANGNYGLQWKGAT